MFHTLAEKLQRAPVGTQAAGRICTAKDAQETNQVVITQESHMQNVHNSWSMDAVSMFLTLKFKRLVFRLKRLVPKPGSQVAGGRGREKQTKSEEKGLFLEEKQMFQEAVETLVSRCQNKGFFWPGEALFPGGKQTFTGKVAEHSRT